MGMRKGQGPRPGQAGALRDQAGFAFCPAPCACRAFWSRPEYRCFVGTLLPSDKKPRHPETRPHPAPRSCLACSPGALALPHLLAPGPRCGLCRCGAMGFSPSLCSPHPHAPDHVTSRTPLLAAAFLGPCLCQGSPERLRWWKACHVYEGGMFPGIDLCGMGGRIGVTHKADSHTLRDSERSLSPRTVS